MKFTVELNEKAIQQQVVEEAIRYFKEKQFPHMIGTIVKQVAQEVKGELVDSGLMEKRVEEVVKKAETTLMSRAHKQFSDTMDSAMSLSNYAFEASIKPTADSKHMRDHIICALIGFQNDSGNDVNSEEYKAYQKVLEWVENTYGSLMS